MREAESFSDASCITRGLSALDWRNRLASRHTRSSTWREILLVSCGVGECPAKNFSSSSAAARSIHLWLGRASGRRIGRPLSCSSRDDSLLRVCPARVDLVGGVPDSTNGIIRPPLFQLPLLRLPALEGSRDLLGRLRCIAIWLASHIGVVAGLRAYRCNEVVWSHAPGADLLGLKAGPCAPRHLVGGFRR